MCPRICHSSFSISPPPTALCCNPSPPLSLCTSYYSLSAARFPPHLGPLSPSPTHLVYARLFVRCAVLTASPYQIFSFSIDNKLVRPCLAALFPFPVFNSRFGLSFREASHFPRNPPIPSLSLEYNPYHRYIVFGHCVRVYKSSRYSREPHSYP